jgi:hypothetical protein
LIITEKSDHNATITTQLKMHNRIMNFSKEELKEEAAWNEGEELSVLHLAAGVLHLPLDGSFRLMLLIPTARTCMAAQ